MGSLTNILPTLGIVSGKLYLIGQVIEKPDKFLPGAFDIVVVIPRITEI